MRSDVELVEVRFAEESSRVMICPHDAKPDSDFHVNDITQMLDSC